MSRTTTRRQQGSI